MAPAASPTGVQSVTRAFELLEVVAAAGGQLAISEMATTSGLPLPTIHRLVRTLVELGYMRQLPNRHYALGARLVPLGEVAGLMLGSSVRPVLESLVDALGESANLAMLEGDRVVYVGQVPSRHSMRMFTEVGRRVYTHSTGVGKAVLAQLSDEQIRALLARTGMPAQTPHTLTTPDALLDAVHRIRRHGYAIDEAEQEVGVRCVAVPVPTAHARMAVSVSGPAPRMTADLVARAIPLLVAASDALAAEDAERVLA